jgi:hypothetical protein
MNNRWDGPLKISQNGPGTPASPPTQTRKQAKEIIFFKNLLLQNQNW